MIHIPSHLMPFLGVVAIITIAPGPDTALVIRNTVQYGIRHGVLTAIGCTAGLLVWGCASALGVAAMLSSSAQTFSVLRMLGAAYLMFLGLRMLWSAAHATPGAPPGAPTQARPSGGRRPCVSLGEGLLADLLNPKAAAFFTALLPQFVRPPDDGLPAIMALALIAAAAALVGFSAYALIAMRVRASINGRRVHRLLDGVTGATLLGLGLGMIREGVRLR